MCKKAMKSRAAGAGGLYPLFTTVSYTHLDVYKRQPVKTAAPIPKPLLLKAMDALAEVTVKAPVHVGDVVIRDLLGTGVDLVATKEM